MKPNFSEIIKIDSSRATADIAVDSIGNNPGYFEEVLSISIHEREPFNWRACRVIYLCSMKHHELFKPHANKIAEIFPEFKTDGQKRGYAYLLSRYINELDENSQSQMIDTCFNYMLSDEKIAVKYNCMKFLYEISKKIPELKGELLAAIEVNLSDGTFKLNGQIKKIYKDIELKVN
jgi:hypothetical protein